MTRALIPLFALALAGATPVHAQSAFDAAKADGKAFGAANTGTAQSAATTTPDATRIPNFSGANAQSTYFDDPTRMAADAAAQASSHAGYQAMRSSSATRARFAAVDLDATIARSKAISDDPLAYTSGMSIGGTQGRCVPLPPGSGSAGRYMATCDISYTLAQTTSSCAIPLGVSFQDVAAYRYYAEVPLHTGLAPPISQFAGALASGTCTSIGRADPCQVARAYGFRARRRCAQYRTDIVECSAAVPGLTGRLFPATGQLWFWQGVTRAASTAPDPSGCASLAADAACTATPDICTNSSPLTRTIGGVAVTAPCWAWRRDYQCNRMTAAQDCDTLAATPGCIQQSETCITGQTPCLSFERVYDCPLPPTQQSTNQFICDGDVYCIDGSCETIARTPNAEFKDALVALKALDQARREFDPNSLTLFKGTRETCSSKIFGVLNCCKGKGFPLIPGIQLLVSLGCSRAEMLLHQRDAQGLCAYVGSYCSSSVLGVCLTKQKVYCCFTSKLSRILQEQGRQQLGKPWAKPRQEQCAGFTVDEFARLDLSQMDFSEVYAEFTAAARLPDELQATQDIQQKIEDYYARSGP